MAGSRCELEAGKLCEGKMASLVHEKWTFQPLPTKQFAALVDSDVKDLLMKWYAWRCSSSFECFCCSYCEFFQVLTVAS